MSNCLTICVDKKPKEYTKLFFGDYGNFQRIDKEPFPVFKRLAKASEANVWFTDEVDYTKDKKGIETLPDHAIDMFHKNILYQNIMDSMVPNVFSFLSDTVTETWLSYLYSRIGTEEQIHALSYSTGLLQVFGAKTTDMLDYVYQDKMLKKRTEKEVSAANTFIENVVFNGEQDKKAVLELLLRIFVLEGLKFPYSFLVTWSINKAFGNAIQGFSQSLKLIAHDELTVHTTTGSNVLRILLNNEEQGFSHLKDWFTEFAYDVIKETSESELEWNNYIIKEPIPGLNKDIGAHFIRYFTDHRLNQLGLPLLYNEEKSDIIDWFNNYRKLNKTQVALQEADNTNYQKGTLKNDLDRLDRLGE